jgi:L-Ala-D/L-Glu epimerase
MKAVAEPLDLTLRHTFTIARGSYDQVNNVLLRIRDGAHEGLGEAAPTRFYGQTQAIVLRTLRKFIPSLAAATPFDLESILSRAWKKFPDCMSAVCAMDLALHDLIGKRLGLPLWKYFGLDRAKTPQTSFTIGLASLDKVAQKIAEAARFPILKIKLGVVNDLEIMREVRRLVPKKQLRVDANCGWSVKETITISKAKQLEKLGVEFIEQPIPPGDNAALRRIKNRIGLPIITDESSLHPEDIPALRGCVDGINIKLVKCGGLREALKMIHIARACDLKIMLGCMIESSVLISAAAQLSPLVDYADLDGNVLIRNDPFMGVALDRSATLRLNNRAGLGIAPTNRRY